jgi:WD40 repeat protein/transcriptional regulator with XRE-family HTH domain
MCKERSTPMTRHSYRERDYTFGQTMLTLRTSIGLTQASLADLLGVSRRAVGEWEGGLTYPKAEHLQHFLELCVQQHVFPPEREEEEIRTLWKTTRQRVLLDEAWLSTLLARSPAAPAQVEEAESPAVVQASPAPVQLSPSAEMLLAPTFAERAATPRIDWVGALDVSHFSGREVEVAELSEWILEERCRLIALLGMGGIGKSALASLLGIRLAPQFEAVLWRSVRDAPPCEDLVADCLTFFSETPPAAFPSSLEQRINQLVTRLQASRCLLMLDNLETLLASGDPAGGYLPGYEGYGRLIERLAESAHQSCVLLTSREKPREIEVLEGLRRPVRSLRLVGMNDHAARDLLADKGLGGTPAAWQRLVASYAGNPLALKIVAQTASDLFGGDIDRFLEEGELVFNGVRPLLRQQVGRLTSLEHLLLMWLAVLREWTELNTLAQVLHPQVLRVRLLEALEALRRRSLLERGQQASFSLQSVVMEYLTDELGERLAEEIVQGNPQQLRRVALEQAQAKNYVRQTQVRLLGHPILERLRSELGADALVEVHLLHLLEQFRAEGTTIQAYGPANIISLLKELRGHLRGLDLSQLAIRGASLQGVEMQDASLAGATLRDSTFTETFDATWSVGISGNGTYWAVGSERGEVCVWREEGKLLHRAWQAHTNTVKSLAFSPDERTLATSSWDGAIKLWDLERGSLLWTGWQTSSIQRLAFAPDGRTLASGGDDAVIRLWDAHSGTQLQTLTGHSGPVHALAWSPNGRLLASAGFDQQIRLWERPLAQPETSMQVLVGHTNMVLGLAFAPDGRILASASWDRTVKLWDVESQRLRETLTGHIDKVLAVVWSPDGHLVASCGLDRTIWLWDVELSSYRTTLHGHTAGVYAIAFTPDNRSLLSGSEDGTVRVWDAERGQCVQIMQGYAVSIYDVAWSADGTQLASAGTDLLVTIWDVPASTPPRVLRGHNWNVYGVTWSPDGQRLASSGWDNAIRVWDANAGESQETLRDPDYVDTLFYGLEWSPDGKFLATGSYQRGVQVWEMTTSTRLWVGRGQPAKIRRVAWSPDGTQLASCGDDGSICLWKASDGTLLAKLQEHRGIVASVAWSSDGARLASCGGGMGSGELFVWDARSGERLYTWSEPSEIVYALTWSPTGTMLVSGSSDGRLRWWDLQSGECVRVREAHQGAIQSLRSSPDGQRLASCGDDGAINVWECESGDHLRTLQQDRPYERLDISGVQGLTDAQRATLRALGAIEDGRVARL